MPAERSARLRAADLDLPTVKLPLARSGFRKSTGSSMGSDFSFGIGGRRLVAIQVDAIQRQREIHAAAGGVVGKAAGELRFIQRQRQVGQARHTALPGVVALRAKARQHACRRASPAA